MKPRQTRVVAHASTIAMLILLPLATLLVRGFLVSNGLIEGDENEVAANNALTQVTGMPMVPPDWHLMNDRFRLLDRTDIARALNDWWLDDSHIVALQIASPPLEFAFFVNGEQQEDWRRVDFEKQMGKPTGSDRSSMPYQVTIRTAWDIGNPESHPKLSARIMTEATDVTTGFKRRLEEVQVLETNVTVPAKEIYQDELGNDRSLRTIDYSFPAQKTEALTAQIADAFLAETQATGHFRLWRATFNLDAGDCERHVELVVRPLQTP